MERCENCWLRAVSPWGRDKDVCTYWGFRLWAEQRACSKFHPKLVGEFPEHLIHAYPIGKPMESISFPSEMLNVHDLSNKRHKLIFKTVCVQGVWYIGQQYQRHYDDCYGASSNCSIYDGDYATEKEAINAKIEQLIKSEQYYRCEEAVQFLKSKRFENQQLTLFDV